MTSTLFGQLGSDHGFQTQQTELLQRLSEVSHLQAAIAILSWDQSTYMPAGGNSARSGQLATLSRLSHEKFTDPAVGRLLDALEPAVADLPADSDEAALLRLTRRKYEESIRVPASFASEFAEHTSDAFAAWAAARPANDFAAVQPYLEKTVEMSRQYADFFPGYEHPADPHIARQDYGMKAATLREIFADLRAQTLPILEAITAQEQVDNSVLHKHYPQAAQHQFGLMASQAYGYDLNRGRLDETHHPFATRFAHDDVRITTRYNEHDLGDSLFGTLHETGHALYELGVSPLYEGTPLARGTSSGVHESQSRLWENQVGRSRMFWQHYFPLLQETFPEQLDGVSLDEFYRAINRVEPSLIRTEADEVTYNLHVIIRFDLELALLEGTLAVADLPEAWHARYQSDLGVRAPDDRNGVLQDVHWFAGSVGGMFQGYTLGNIMSAQFFAAALEAHPQIPEQIARSEFETLHNWLHTNVYQYGSKFTTQELLQRATGSTLNLAPYISYLQTKYGEIYGFTA